jgi:signal transduction histidine kinase
MYIVEEECDLEAVQIALRDVGVDVSAAIRSGAFVLSTKAQSYLRDGHFSPERMLAFWKTELQRARKDGYSGFRGTGVADCVTLSSRGFTQWIEYESLATNTFAETGCLCLCQYDRRISSPELVLDVIRAHPIVICGDTVCQNFYFVPPDEFLAPRRAEREIDSILRTLKQHERAGEHLRKVHRMEAMGHLAGGIAHDFNNLMAVVTGYSHLLEESLRDNPPLLEKVEQIRKAGDQASSLTRQLLAFTRKQMVQPRLLDLSSAVESLKKMLRLLLSEDTEFVIEHDPRAGLIYADRGQIDQVIMNLVINARDAISKGGKIDIRVSDYVVDEEYAGHHLRAKPGPFVCLTVADNGCGMNKETLERIFEPFFSTKLEGKGTGLGLAMVDGIVEQMGGFIAIESEVEHGTTFNVYFPRIEGAVISESESQILEPTYGTGTILVVEDQEGIQLMVSEILRRRGYTVSSVRNGREALALLENNAGQIDLVITDLAMPIMGGVELANTLRVSYPKVKILYMSGYADDIPALLSFGHIFIEKPFEPNLLLQKVSELLRGAPKSGLA